MKLATFIIALLFISLSTKTSAQELTMFPGFWSVKYYQDAERITKAELLALLKTDQEAHQLWKKSNQHLAIGAIALGAEFGFLFWQLSRADKSESQTVPFIGVLGSAVVAIGFSISSSNLKRKSLLKYNENKDMGSLNFGTTPNGLGLVFSF